MTKLNKAYRCLRIEGRDRLVSWAMDEWKAVHRDSFYDISTLRERMSPALSKTRTYHLRVPDVPQGFITKTTSAQDVLQCKDTELYSKFPYLKLLVDDLVTSYGPEAKLGRVFVTRLDSVASIGRHIDEGLYFDCLHRHHLVLDADSSKFLWDDHEVVLTTGDFVVVNNSIPHWVENRGGMRTHLIFDAG